VPGAWRRRPFFELAPTQRHTPATRP
jgi:hypothetical protein